MTETIGIEIADGELRVARAAHRLGRARLLGCERVPLDATDDVARMVAALVRARPAAVALALPLAVTTHRRLEIPFADARRVREIAPLELLGQLPSEPGDLVVGHTRIARGAAGATILAAAARRTDLARLVDPLVAAGVPVARVGVGAPGVADGPAFAARPDVAIVLADGARSAVVVRAGGALAGLRALATRPAASPEAFAREVRWVLAALDAPPAIVLLGADATPELRTALAAGADHEPELVSGADGSAGACAVAAALALGRGLVIEERADAAGATRRARRVRALAAAAAVLALADVAVLRGGLAVREARLVAAIHDTAAAALPAGTRLVAPRAQLEAAAGAAAARAGTPTGVLVLLRELSARLPSGVPLDLDELTVDPDTLRLHGRTDRFESIDLVVRALGGSAALRDVAVEDSRAAVDGRGVEFAVRAGWRTAPGAPS